ncbi:MAG: Crp/Fnr family transcriptional regulator [Myxococcota bacterium]
MLAPTTEDPRIDISLATHAFLSLLDESTRRFLVSRARRLTWAPGARLVEEGAPLDRLILLCQGSLKLRAASGFGTEATLATLAAPASFGHGQAISGQMAPVTLEAAEAVLTLEIPGSALTEALAASPSLAIALVSALREESALVQSKLREALFLPVSTRVARLFVEQAELYGVAGPDGTRIKATLKQEEIAVELGIARRSVTRALRAWRAAGVIMKRGGHYIVRDRDGLMRFASGLGAANASAL